MSDLKTAIDHATLLHRRGKFEEAIVAYQLVVSIDPRQLAAHQAIGELLLQLGRPIEAVESLRQLTEAAPQISGGWLLFAQALAGSGQTDAAISAYGKVIRTVPHYVPALYALADLQNNAGRPALAIEPLQSALRIEPQNPSIHNLLARVYTRLDRHLDALPHHQRAAELMPALDSMQNNYGVALHRAGRLADAERQLRGALSINPMSAAASTNLAGLLREQGRCVEAADLYRRAMTIKPDSGEINSIYLYTLHFDPTVSAAEIQQEHQRWFDRHLSAVAPVHRTGADISRDKGRLRVGYISADFRQHVVGRFLEPILRHHNREQFEIFCYSDTTAIDTMTDRLRSSSDQWRETAGLDHEKLATQIAVDEIDILIDSTGHMENSRLNVFARQPAPVQISHIGYPASSGVPQIQFRVTDQYLDPTAPAGSIEILLYLPDSFYLYANEMSSIDKVDVPPVVRHGFVTFGSLNSPAKISDVSIALWAGAMLSVAGSKFLLVVPPDLSISESIAGRFIAHGISRDRLIFEPARSFDEYLKLYNHIDIALDPQPYGGGITSCDALWMGVPVVSLNGKTSVGRIGVSILHAMKMEDLVGQTPEQYAGISAKLAADADRLQDLRVNLPGRFHASPLTDAVKYTAAIESLYRTAFAQPIESRK